MNRIVKYSFFAWLIGCIVLSCYSSNKGKSGRLNFQAIHQKEVLMDTLHTKPTSIQIKNAKKQVNASYSVMTLAKQENPGEDIFVEIHSNQQVIKINQDAIYFVKLVDDWLVLDEGTGNRRNLIILDLNTFRCVFHVNYLEELHWKKDKVELFTPTTIPKTVQKPICDKKLENSGLQRVIVDRWLIDVKAKEIAKTGDFKCMYIE